MAPWLLIIRDIICTANVQLILKCASVELTKIVAATAQSFWICRCNRFTSPGIVLIIGLQPDKACFRHFSRICELQFTSTVAIVS